MRYIANRHKYRPDWQLTVVRLVGLGLGVLYIYTHGKTRVKIVASAGVMSRTTPVARSSCRVQLMSCATHVARVEG